MRSSMNVRTFCRIGLTCSGTAKVKLLMEFPFPGTSERVLLRKRRTRCAQGHAGEDVQLAQLRCTKAHARPAADDDEARRGAEGDGGELEARHAPALRHPLTEVQATCAI